MEAGKNSFFVALKLFVLSNGKIYQYHFLSFYYKMEPDTKERADYYENGSR